MKPNTNKMLLEKAAAIARAMDSTFEKNEANTKAAELASKRASEYAAETRRDRAEMEALAYRAAIGHAAAIAAGVILNAAAGAVAAWLMIR